MTLPTETTKQLRKIKELHQITQTTIEGVMMQEVRRQMREFAQKLKPTTTLKLDCGMGVINFVIIRPGLPKLWLGMEDLWYQQDPSPAPKHPHLHSPPRLMRDRPLYPLIQCLQFMESVNSETGVWPDKVEVKGTRTCSLK